MKVNSCIIHLNPGAGFILKRTHVTHGLLYVITVNVYLTFMEITIAFQYSLNCIDVCLWDEVEGPLEEHLSGLSFNRRSEGNMASSDLPSVLTRRQRCCWFGSAAGHSSSIMASRSSPLLLLLEFSGCSSSVNCPAIQASSAAARSSSEEKKTNTSCFFFFCEFWAS